MTRWVTYSIDNHQPDTKQIIANRLRSYMSSTNTSIADLSKKSGVSISTIWCIINCLTDPRLSTLVKLENIITRKLTLSK